MLKTIIANNTAPYDGIFKISHGGGNPYVAVFIRSGDTYYIENIPPGEKITATFGENWDNDRKMFTKNVYSLYLGEATPIRRSTQRHEW